MGMINLSDVKGGTKLIFDNAPEYGERRFREAREEARPSQTARAQFADWQ